MKKLLLLLVLSNFLNHHSYSQDFSKLNMRLASMIANPLMQQKQVNLLVQGDISAIRAFTADHNGIIRYSYGNIAAIKIPVSEIAEFTGKSYVKRLEMPGGNAIPMNDSMRAVTHINEVQAGMAPLTQGYDGTGVVIGIMDTGVDLTHPDLQDSAGNTRIKYLWDQRKPLAANTPSYGYGQEWDAADIDAGNANSDDMQWYGHGTHVTGVAAGDGSAIGKNRGGAPKADIVEVAFDFNNATDPTYSDAVDYIFNKAQLLGKPCVINASLGDYYGSHDGQDLQSQLINTLLNQQTGRAIVAAAGNTGTVPFHLSYNVTTDTSFTWLTHNPGYQTLYFQVWADVSNFANVHFSLGADVNSTSASFRGKLPFTTISNHLGVFRQDTLFSISGNRLAIVQSFGSIQGSAYLMEYNVIPDSTSYLWRWSTTGSGKFDLWKFYDGTLSPGFIYTNLPSASTVPDIIYYQLPDANSTIVSGFQCLNNVIAVGNYGNRNSYTTYNLTTYTDSTITPGQIAVSSSWGPTRDGRIKPDITAPGGLMLSCGQLSLLNIWVNQPNNAPKVAEGGFHFRDGGTSSASPVVAGIAALYLQKNPTATAADVKNAITQCAVQDSFTGTNLPNNIWGFGKVDAFNALVNCSLTTSLAETPITKNLQIFPNPVVAGTVITVFNADVSADENSTVNVVDAFGKIVFTVKTGVDGKTLINTKKLAAGLYMVRIRNGEKIISAGKLSVIR